jgi:predicted DNA-binding transcriptional regulator AlpA
VSELAPIRLAEMMARCGYRDRDAFRAFMRRAEAELGFPRPIKPRPLTWRRGEVDAWFAGDPSPSRPPAAANDLGPDAGCSAVPSEADEIAAARARLQAKSMGR